MKRIASLLLSLLLLVSVSYAESINLASLSFDELAALRDQIMLEMMSRDEWQEVTVPVGTYQVGVHIPAGHWMINPTDGAYCYITIGGTLEENGKEVKYGSPGYYHAILVNENCRIYDPGDQSFVDLDLKYGMYICIENSSVAFTPYSCQPDLGFSFN